MVPHAEVDELLELWVEARWSGLPVRVVATLGGDPELVRVFSLARDADLAEALRLEKLDAAVYEATVRAQDLADVVPTQLGPVTRA